MMFKQKNVFVAGLMFHHGKNILVWFLKQYGSDSVLPTRTMQKETLIAGKTTCTNSAWWRLTNTYQKDKEIEQKYVWHSSKIGWVEYGALCGIEAADGSAISGWPSPRLPPPGRHHWSGHSRVSAESDHRKPWKSILSEPKLLPMCSMYKEPSRTT